MKQRKAITPKQKQTFTQHSIELASESEKVIESIPKEVYQQLASFQKKGCEETIYDFIQQKNDFIIEQVDILKNLSQELEKYLLESCEQDLIVNQQIISFIKQVFDNRINEEQFNQTIQNWQGNSLSPLEIKKISEGFNLYRQIQMLETKIIISKTVQSYRETQQFAFYNKLFRVIVNQEKVIIDKEEQIFENLELIAINFINNQENNSALKQFMNGQKFYLQLLLNHKQIIEFLIARHFDKWLSKISEAAFKSDRTIFTSMRDQSKIKNINFINAKYSGALDFVKEIYQQRESQKIRLIKMVQASAFLNNFEQESGNAMTVLSSLESTIRNQNFSSINLKNSTMNKIQFFETNFTNSNMNNNAQLKMLIGPIQKVHVQIFQKDKFKLDIQNKIIQYQQLLLKKLILIHITQIKILYKQSYITNHKSQLKLSCLGQVIVFNDIGISIFWSIQAQKKIRYNYDGKSWRKFSNDYQILVQKSSDGNINLWKIYNTTQNLKIQAKNIAEVKFSKNNQIGYVYGCEDTNSEIRSIKIMNDTKVSNQININKEIGKTKFALSPDFQKLAFFCKDSICIQSINDQKKNIQQQKFDLKKGSRFDITQGGFQGMKFSPNSEYLAIHSEVNYGRKISMNISIQIWRISDSKIVFEQEESFKSPSDFQGYEFSYDGQYFGILLNSITVYDIYKKKQNKKLRGYSQGTFAFSLDGQYLASQNQKVIQLWQIDQERIIQNLQGHTGYITKIIFLNDDWIIVSASLDGSIRIWDGRRGQQIQILQQNYFGIISLSISSYQQRMISLDQEGTVVFWSNSEFENSKTSNRNNTMENNIIQKQYHYTPYQIQGNQKFIAYNCNIKGSKIFSTEGYNLCNIFNVN